MVPASAKRVLIIDDDPDDFLLMREALEAIAIECLSATSAEEGLVVAREANPDLILLDLMLPKASGFGFLRELKKRPELADIPVIVVTALRDQEVASVSMDIGASAFLAKACMDSELLPMVREFTA